MKRPFDSSSPTLWATEAFPPEVAYPGSPRRMAGGDRSSGSNTPVSSTSSPNRYVMFVSDDESSVSRMETIDEGDSSEEESLGASPSRDVEVEEAPKGLSPMASVFGRKIAAATGRGMAGGSYNESSANRMETIYEEEPCEEALGASPSRDVRIEEAPKVYSRMASFIGSERAAATGQSTAESGGGGGPQQGADRSPQIPPYVLNSASGIPAAIRLQLTPPATGSSTGVMSALRPEPTPLAMGLSESPPALPQQSTMPPTGSPSGILPGLRPESSPLATGLSGALRPESALLAMGLSEISSALHRQSTMPATESSHGILPALRPNKSTPPATGLSGTTSAQSLQSIPATAGSPSRILPDLRPESHPLAAGASHIIPLRNSSVRANSILLEDNIPDDRNSIIPLRRSSATIAGRMLLGGGVLVQDPGDGIRGPGDIVSHKKDNVPSTSNSVRPPAGRDSAQGSKSHQKFMRLRRWLRRHQALTRFRLWLRRHQTFTRLRRWADRHLGRGPRNALAARPTVPQRAPPPTIEPQMPPRLPELAFTSNRSVQSDRKPSWGDLVKLIGGA